MYANMHFFCNIRTLIFSKKGKGDLPPPPASFTLGNDLKIHYCGIPQVTSHQVTKRGT